MHRDGKPLPLDATAGRDAIHRRAGFIAALWSTAVSYGRRGAAGQPSTGMVSRDHYGYFRPPLSGDRQEGSTLCLRSRSLSAIRARAGPRVSSGTSTNAGGVSSKSTCGNQVPAVGPRHCRKRRLEISAVQNKARKKPGNRQVDAPCPQ